MPVERTPFPTPLQRILRGVKALLPVLAAARALSAISRKVNSAIHRLQFLIEWGVDNPEHFDHFLEQHYSWRKDKYSIGWERGVLSSIALQKDGQKQLPRVLELCCGDGFNTLHFYSVHAISIVAVDFDTDAIANARKRNGAKNIDYQLCDIRTQIPAGPFDNIIWDAAIEHFTDEEVAGIFSQILKSLAPDGILSGYTLLEDDDGGMHLHQHEREFSSKADLARLLSPHFKNVHILQTSMPSRENLYFFASNGLLPFEDSKNLIINNP
jgi:SAM-dependent methyltransferase